MIAATAYRYDDGIPELTPAEWCAREAARRAWITNHFCGPQASTRPMRIAIGGADVEPRRKVKNGARTPGDVPRSLNRGRPSTPIVDLETGRVYGDAHAAARSVGPTATADSVRKTIRLGNPYGGRWLAWWTPALGSDPGARRREIARRELRRAAVSVVRRKPWERFKQGGAA